MNTMTNATQKKPFITTALGIGLLACLCCLLWGSATPAIKIGYEWFGIGAGDIASRILFAGVRFILAGILTAIFGSLIARKPLFPQKTLPFHTAVFCFVHDHFPFFVRFRQPGQVKVQVARYPDSLLHVSVNRQLNDASFWAGRTTKP